MEGAARSRLRFNRPRDAVARPPPALDSRIDSEETNPTTPYLVKSITVDVTDGNVTTKAGQKDEYTMLDWMSIEPAN